MISTKFGNAYQRKDGYWKISSGVHQGELLHRLVYEDAFGPIPDGFCVHHINGNKNDNFILKWKCSEEELLGDLNACETYSEVMEVLYDNMIISVGG